MARRYRGRCCRGGRWAGLRRRRATAAAAAAAAAVPLDHAARCCGAADRLSALLRAWCSGGRTNRAVSRNFDGAIMRPGCPDAHRLAPAASSVAAKACAWCPTPGCGLGEGERGGQVLIALRWACKGLQTSAECEKGYPRACNSRGATHQSTAQQGSRGRRASASSALPIAAATPKDLLASGIAWVLAHAGARTRHCRQPHALRATPRNRHSIDVEKHDESAARGCSRSGPAPCCRSRRSSRSGLAARPQAVRGAV